MGLAATYAFPELLEDYLAKLPTEQRKRYGEVYTPAPVVEYILDAVGYTPRRAIDGRRLIDPACGGGVFLLAALERLVRRHIFLGRDPTSKRDARAIARDLEQSLFGIDISGESCRNARLLLEAEAQRLLPALEGGEFLPSIYERDFLLNVGMSSPRRLPRSFHFVVGNPPYVEISQIPAESRAAYKERYTSARGRLDLYVLFIEAGLDVLGNGGRLGFITSNKFVQTESALELRKLLATEVRLLQLIDFANSDIFREVTAYPLILIAEKAKPREQIPVVRVFNGGPNPLPSIKKSVGKEVTTPDLESYHVERAGLATGAWHLVPRRLEPIFEKLKAAGIPLREHVERASAGTATGKDDVFVVDEKLAALLRSEGLVRPAVRGKDVHRWRIEHDGLYIIVPGEVRNGKAHLVDLDDARYVRTRQYLSIHRRALEARYCVKKGARWYDHHDTLEPDLGAKARILVPDIAGMNHFVVNDGRFHPLHTCYYLVPKNGVDEHFLAGVLNTKPAEFFLKCIAPRFNHGYYRYRTQFLEQIPIPTASRGVARRIAVAAGECDDQRLDELVMSLYDLTERDMDHIAGYLTKTRATTGPALGNVRA